MKENKNITTVYGPGNSPDSENDSSDDEMSRRGLSNLFTGTRRRSFNLLKFLSWKTTMWNHVITDAGSLRPPPYPRRVNTVTDNNEVHERPLNATSQSGETEDAPIENTIDTQTVSNIEPNLSNSSFQNNEGTPITSPNTSAEEGTSEQMIVPSTSRFVYDTSVRNSFALKKRRKRKYELRHTRIKLPYYKSCLSKKLFKK